MSCTEKDDTGFPLGVDPNSNIEGTWNSIAYDFSQTNLATQSVDSVFSFTGPILIENFQANGERLRKFLGFTESYQYSRVNDKLFLSKDGDTMVAKLVTLQASHLAYTIEHNVMVNDTLRRHFSSAQLTR